MAVLGQAVAWFDPPDPPVGRVHDIHEMLIATACTVTADGAHIVSAIAAAVDAPDSVPFRTVRNDREIPNAAARRAVRHRDALSGSIDTTAGLIDAAHMSTNRH